MNKFSIKGVHLFIFCFAVQIIANILLCDAQSRINFWGNQNQSEYFEDFFIESDSTAIAMVNISAPFTDSKVAIFRIDTAMNVHRYTRYFKPNTSLTGHGFTNHSNGRIVFTFSELDITNFKNFYSLYLFDDNLDTISNTRIKPIDEDYYFGLTSLLLHDDKFYGLMHILDSSYNEHLYLVKIDLLNKVVLSQVELLPPQNRLIYVSDVSIDSIQNKISFGMGIETDSASNFFNPCLIILDTTFTILNTFFSADTIDPNDGIVNIMHLDNENYLFGYYRKSINPFTARNYYLAKTNISNGIVFEKLLAQNFKEFNYATSYDTIQHRILLISSRNTILLDSLGNTIYSIGHLTNPVFAFSNLGISGFHIWNQKPILTGSFNFGTSEFDAAFIWLDSNLTSCDHTYNSLYAIDTTNNFTTFPLQLTSVDSLIEFTQESYLTDSTSLVSYSYCNTTSTSEIKNAPQLKVYPNPTNGLFHIANQITSGINRKPVTCKIFDLTGRFVKKINFIGYDVEYSFQECEAGMYLFVLSTDDDYQYTTIIFKN